MIKRLIFDVDGTLITGVGYKDVSKNTLEKLGIYSEERLNIFLRCLSDYEQYHKNYNKNDYQSYLEKNLDIKLGDDFFSIFFEELKYCVSNNTSKLKETLGKLSTKYEMVLLTNFFKESQLNRLKTMEIDYFFTECYGEELVKPNDAIYLKACEQYKPCECVMIGDNLELDVLKAKELGLKAIFVNSKNIRIDSNNVCMINSTEDLSIELIENLKQ